MFMSEVKTMLVFVWRKTELPLSLLWCTAGTVLEAAESSCMEYKQGNSVIVFLLLI